MSSTATSVVTIPVNKVVWKPCYRIIPSRFPPIHLFERIADPSEWDSLAEIEGLTNPRLRDEIGDLSLVPPDERVGGPGSTVIMSAFFHLNPAGSRFTDGSFGVFYAGSDLATAVAETKHHRIKFLAATSEAPIDLDMRVYVVDLDADLHDIRGMKDDHQLVYHLNSYAAGQMLANHLRSIESYGIVYDSVRHSGGECVAVFRPKALSNCRQERHLCYVWDGTTISNVYEKSELKL